MTAWPVADLRGAITQLLLCARISEADSPDVAARTVLPASCADCGAKWTGWVARLKRRSTFLGRQGSRPAGMLVCHGGSSLERTASACRPAAHATRARA